MHRVLFDFADPQAALAWQAIDDRVMGGRSRSRLRHEPAGHALWEGDVSLADGGGFASLRCRPGPLGLAGAQAVVLTLRGPARAFQLGLLDSDALDAVQHQAGFASDGGAGWQTLRLPLAGFVPTLRGRALAGVPALDRAGIRQLGLLTAGRTPGPFVLALRSIWLDDAP